MKRIEIRGARVIDPASGRDTAVRLSALAAADSDTQSLSTRPSQSSSSLLQISAPGCTSCTHRSLPFTH